jgi:hypothetical protein
MRCLWCQYLLWLITGAVERLNPGPEEEEVMESLPLALSKEFRRCQNIKSRTNPDAQCPFAALHGDYCSRHTKNPRPFRARRVSNEIQEATPSAAAAATKIQRAWRLRAPLLRFAHQGPASNALNLAGNETELYSMDPLSSIPAPYRFSYADEKRHIWMFDIRTLGHSMATGFPQQNPYTREILPAQALNALHNRIAWLRSRKYQILHINTDVLTPEQCWNQKVLDIFLKIEALGYYACPDWFHGMTAYHHSLFYKKLFDLWEYRLALTAAEKEAVVPGHLSPGARRLFRFPPDTQDDRDRGWWARMNLSIMEAFVTRATDKERQKLGAMYVLMGLVQASRPAARALPWVVESVYA